LLFLKRNTLSEVRVAVNVLHTYKNDAVAQLVEALRYKPEGRGCHWNFSVT
jgi:hypothetical protein